MNGLGSREGWEGRDARDPRDFEGVIKSAASKASCTDWELYGTTRTTAQHADDGRHGKVSSQMPNRYTGIFDAGGQCTNVNGT